jgi:hypothetical protein
MCHSPVTIRDGLRGHPYWTGFQKPLTGPRKLPVSGPVQARRTDTGLLRGPVNVYGAAVRLCREGVPHWCSPPPLSSLSRQICDRIDWLQEITLVILLKAVESTQRTSGNKHIGSRYHIETGPSPHPMNKGVQT